MSALASISPGPPRVVQAPDILADNLETAAEQHRFPGIGPVPNQKITHLLADWRDGKPEALEQLMPLVYGELRRLASAYLRRERRGHTLQPTELVHEAYLRLADKTHPQWRDRVHFYAVAAQLMRRILVDHARSVQSQKRGGAVVKIPLAMLDDVADKQAADLIAVDEALRALAEIDERKARILELRYFAGLTIAETARLLEISTATVITDTRMARAWMYGELHRGDRD